MSEKRIRNYEVKCLLELLSAIINEEEIPKWVRQPQWGDLYKLADYHGVANVVYYAVLASEERALAPWKPKFSERFHQSVLADQRYFTAVPQLLKLLEEYKVHCLLLTEYRMCHYYPQPDMRALKSVHLLIEKGREKKAEEAMAYLDYEEQESRTAGERVFYKIPGIKVILQTDFSFTNKKMEKYFSIPVKSYEKEKNNRYIHTFLPEELYVHVIGCAAESYARGNLDIRDMLDIWVYYRRVYKELDWEQITKEIGFLKLEKFHLYLIRLAAYWFGGMLFPESDSVFEAMEKYILTKGVQGRRISATLLPLVNEVADFYAKDLKKKRREQIKIWLFPHRDYMETMFPVLKKARWLLPACRLLRLLRLGRQQVWLTFRKGYAAVRGSVVKCTDSVKGFWKAKREAVTDFTDPKAECIRRKLRGFRQKGFTFLEGIREKLDSWWQILKGKLNIHK